MRRAGFRWGGVCALALLGLPAPALAWKPYTHNTTAVDAYRDALDGFVTVDGRQYAVPPALVTALNEYPQFYNAGVIGPDGFPDLTFGQSVIHPEHTGAWLGHILRSAQQAQNNPGLTVADKRKILAFTYGFLTHAAGDMWGHTFVNDFARGVFPGVGEILSSADKAAIAVRHIVAEGYIGDTTPGPDFAGPLGPDGPGLDGNPDRTTLPGGDVSDDRTPGFPYDAPHDFIYRTLIDPAAATPAPDRGPIIDLFLTMKDGLELFASADPLSAAISAWDDVNAVIARVEEACDFDEASDVIDCPAVLLELAFETVEAFFESAFAALAAAVDAVMDAYIGAWVDDIDTGLRNWSRLGLASTKGLFDAQTRRNLQNDECGLLGGEDTDLRGGCESGIGMLDVIIDATNDFVNQFLLSMLGAPDVVGQVRSILQDVMDAFDDIVNTVLAPINPLREALEDVKNFAKELLKDAISAVLGVDIDSLKSFLTEPSRWVCTDNTTIHFPAPLGDQTLSLFPDGEHERLDDLLGFPPGDGHHVQEPSLPLACGRLQDAAEVQFAAVPALRNTVTTAKLLMLDGPELNRALSDILGRTVVHYSAGQNMMVDALQPGETWLQSIDGDHAWRQDGLPRFCDEGGNCPGQADPRPAELNGGAGNFPIWESCVLRPAFRALYADWEGGSFPDLDDDVSADDADDPQAPISTLQASGTVYNNGTTTFVAAAHQLTQAAHDGPDGFAFRDDQLALQRRVFADGDVAGPFQAVTQGSSVTLTGTDGLYHVEVQSADDCHRFDGAPSPPEAVQTHSFVLDATAPTIDLVRPANGTEWDTDDTPVVDLQVEDGGLGSGVKRTIGTVGGWDGPGGVWSFDRGDALDMFTFMPGTHTVAVTAIDHLDNTREVTFTFDLHATPQSLLANVQRAARSGLLKAPLGTTLRRSLDAARKAHEQGRHLAEGRNLQAFITQIQSARGQKADPRTVARLVAFAQDRIRLGR